MHLFVTVFFGLIAIFWLTYGLKVAYGASRLPWLKKCAPAADAECPGISLIFAARDEQQKLPGDRWYRIVGHRGQHNPAHQSLHG